MCLSHSLSLFVSVSLSVSLSVSFSLSLRLPVSLCFSEYIRDSVMERARPAAGLRWRDVQVKRCGPLWLCIHNLSLGVRATDISTSQSRSALLMRRSKQRGDHRPLKPCALRGLPLMDFLFPVRLFGFPSLIPPPPPHLFFYLLTYFLSLLQPFSPYFPPFVWFVLHALFAVCSVLCLREVTVRRAHGFFLNPWLVLLEPRVLAGSDRSLVTSEERRSVNFN